MVSYNVGVVLWQMVDLMEPYTTGRTKSIRLGSDKSSALLMHMLFCGEET